MSSLSKPAVTLILVLLVLPGTGFAAAGSQAPQKVEHAIKIQQQTQKNQDKWEDEKSNLVAEYTRLLQQSEALASANAQLTREVDILTARNAELTREKDESQHLLEALPEFTRDLFLRLREQVAQDLPFLESERKTRLDRLSSAMDDPSVSAAARYRRVMEALFIEAEYGATCDVSREKILMDPSLSEMQLATVFRLGRLARFYLSLDKTACGAFDPGDNQWHRLPDAMIPSVRSAVEMVNKQRTAELVSLPLGQLAPKGGEK